MTSPAFHEASQEESTSPTSTKPKLPSAKKKRKGLLVQFLLLLILLLGFAIVVSLFLRTSVKDDGLWIVQKWQYVAEDKATFGDKSLIWTTVPPLLFTLLSMFMKSCYEEILDLEPLLALYWQPTSDSQGSDLLGRDSSTTDWRNLGSNSIFVNYRRESFFEAQYLVKPTRFLPWTAWKRGHKISAGWLLLSPLFHVVAIPLSAHLFESKLWHDTRNVEVMQVTQLNPDVFAQTPDLSRAFHSTSAMEVYGSRSHVYSQWTDLRGNYTFPTFLPTSRDFRYNSTIQFNNVAGYHVSLDNCVYQKSYGGTRVNNNTEVRQQFNATSDNLVIRMPIENSGCTKAPVVSFKIAANKPSLYLKTTPFHCESESSGEALNKLSFIWAWSLPIDNETLSLNETVLTCDPIVRKDTGKLTLNFLDGAAVGNFSTGEPCSRKPNDPPCDDLSFSSGPSQEQALALLHAIATYKTEAAGTKSVESLDFHAEDFGSLVMNRFDVTRRALSTPWLPNDADNFTEFREEMVRSVKSVFRTLALSSLATVGFEEFEWPLDQQRTSVEEYVDVERLFVVPFVAGILLGFLVAAFALAAFGGWKSKELWDWDVDIPDTAVGYLGWWHRCEGADEAAGEILEGMERNEDGLEVSFEQEAIEYTFGDVKWVMECSGSSRRLRPMTTVARREPG